VETLGVVVESEQAGREVRFGLRRVRSRSTSAAARAAEIPSWSAPRSSSETAIQPGPVEDAMIDNAHLLPSLFLNRDLAAQPGSRSSDLVQQLTGRVGVDRHRAACQTVCASSRPYI
jgi:hypothetical protein